MEMDRITENKSLVKIMNKILAAYYLFKWASSKTCKTFMRMQN